MLAAPAWGISSLHNFDAFELEIFAPTTSPDALDVAQEAIIEPEIPVASVPAATGDSDDVDPVATLCAEIDEKLTSVSFEDCMAHKLEPSGAVSIRRKTIATRDFAPSNGKPSGRVLLVGGIHGDEYSAVTAVFNWLEQLEGQQGGDFHWRVVPLLNPDGLLMPPNESQRMNANGVDLNRNFPTPDWEVEAVDYWVNKTRRSKRRYPGTAPLSEPESRWLAGQIEEYQPDAVISVHAPHGIVDFDGPRIPPDNLGPLELRLLGTYPGSMGRYIGVYKGIPLLTIELESALRLPSDEDMDGIWFDMIDWLDAKVGEPNDTRDRNLVEAGEDTGEKRISRAGEDK
ncbi:MAG: M14 family zinc carboxypeptidase [Gammaproteobacteria bacterium]